MKITSVEIHPTGSSDVCVLSFRDPRRLNPYNIKAIAGLDADEIVPKYYGGSGASKQYNLSIEKRDIVVRIELNPNFALNQSVSSLRDDLYRFIAASRSGTVQLRFKNGNNVVAGLSGFINKFEAAHFSKTPEVQLTIACEDPMLRGVDPISIDVGDLSPALTTIEDDLSTAQHGFTFEMEFDANLASFNIHDPDDNWSFEITPVGGFLNNDVLHFSSEKNNKYLHVVRSGNTIHLADVITSGSIWPIIFPKTNEFVCENPGSLTWLSISHYPTYWGV
jgi:hypothetical protein